MKMIKFNKIKKSDIILVTIISIISIIALLTPNKFSSPLHDNTIRVKAEILRTDNSKIIENSIIKTGSQDLILRIEEGKFKNKEISASNTLVGRMEFDKFFEVGDQALTVLNLSKDKKTIVAATAVDHYRINIEIILISIFIIFLICFAGWTGFKAIISFLFTGIAIWKILLPGFLMGYNPIYLSLLITSIITSSIIFLVAGTTKKGMVAFMGSMSGIAVTCIMAIVFGDWFNIHGAIKPFSETLLYSGYQHLSLTNIFLAGIFISSSGAAMDIAVDISASQQEIYNHNKRISRSALIKAGFNIGRAVVGTMTTTLLLAYSGGFSALLMVFIAQKTPMINILNLNYVSGEILHTIVGSLGLVLVAPITAIIGGFLYTSKKQ